MPSKQVTVPASWRLVELGPIAFRFPRDRKIDGHDNLCGVGSAATPNCVLFDEGPILRYESGTFKLRTRDDYGDTGPAREQLGPEIRINGRGVHRWSAADGTMTYVVTAGSGGRDAAVLRWLKPTDALLWISCREEADCQLAEQVAGSMVIKSARWER